ncbi:MAG: methionyl-tRNA formyltransferase, partial [Frankiaceae bacterium]|nr:methionyl-tRNA formyltransferase [Frankiaceae bacterium]
VRLVFAGTPDAALPSLDAIAASDHELVAVVTRPDAPAGRGRGVRRSPVGEWADSRGIPVFTPRRPSEPEFLDWLRDVAPDCCPVVAYGALVPPAALDVPAHGWVNLHFSALPAWRGAAPVQHAILNGDEISGATTFELEAGLDTGPVYGVVTTEVGVRETSGELMARLASSGAGLLVATLDGIATGEIRPVPQPAEGVSLAPKLTVDDARIDWSHPALRVDRLVRACTPAPGAWTTLRDRRVKLGPVTPLDAHRGAGEIAVEDGRVVAGTGGGSVALGTVQPEGRAAMDAIAWARGLRLTTTDRLI